MDFKNMFQELDSFYIENYKRMDFITLFGIITKLISYKSTCGKTRQGALIIKDNRIISFGYNGSPPGGINCIEHKEMSQIICKKDNSGSCLNGVHAEQNAIAFAAKNGINIQNSEIYITQSPCINCARLISSSGIKKVYYLEKYRIEEGLDFLKSYNIECEMIQF